MTSLVCAFSLLGPTIFIISIHFVIVVIVNVCAFSPLGPTIFIISSHFVPSQQLSQRCIVFSTQIS